MFNKLEKKTYNSVFGLQERKNLHFANEVWILNHSPDLHEIPKNKMATRELGSQPPLYTHKFRQAIKCPKKTWQLALTASSLNNPTRKCTKLYGLNLWQFSFEHRPVFYCQASIKPPAKCSTGKEIPVP